MKTTNSLIATALYCFLCGLSTVAGDTMAGSDGQERRLLSPTPQQRAAEARGQIFIYEGLDEELVDLALDDQFERVQSMMFIRTKPAEADAYAWINDGCD
jgi:hypothetical protein